MPNKSYIQIMREQYKDEAEAKKIADKFYKNGGAVQTNSGGRRGCLTIKK